MKVQSPYQLPDGSGESSRLLPSSNDGQDDAFSHVSVSSRSWWKSKMGLLSMSVCAVMVSTMIFLHNANGEADLDGPLELEGETDSILLHHHFMGNLLGSKKKKKKKLEEKKTPKYPANTTYLSRFVLPTKAKRCDWVMDQFHERDEGTAEGDLEVRYVAQSQDPNVFYRATAHIFWKDFGVGEWGGDFTRTFLLHNDPDSDDSAEEADFDPENIQKQDGAVLTHRDVWTWVTGDQHLSNFGAWKNRHGDVVFGVNDFDEAAIYDFQVDVVRIAVSICSHAITNKLTEEEVDEALAIFFDSYVKAVLNYQDNEDALLFELTPKTAKGALKKFLKKTSKKKSNEKQLTKFTTHDPATGKRHFIKGGIDIPHEKTRLATVHPDKEEEIRKSFSRTRYGATMMKLGWAVPPWDDKFYHVLDVAARIGSGIGSFGVDRYYVLLKGRDGLLEEDGEDGSAVILDVKFQPPSAVSRVLNKEDAAWYKVKFENEAARVVEAQRRLTSYTDPFTGYVMLKNLDPNSTAFGEYQPFSIRQRSPWKDSIDLDSLTDPDDFNEFVSQIAVSTATSHVRGSVAKAPGDFKHVIAVLLGGSEKKRIEWGQVVAKMAKAYREQVVLDFECFRDYVQEHYDVPEVEPST